MPEEEGEEENLQTLHGGQGTMTLERQKSQKLSSGNLFQVVHI